MPQTFRSVFGYTDYLLKNKPTRRPGQDIRDVPTYTIPEAAGFLAIPPRTLQYWFLDSSMLSPSGSIGEVTLLSFRDLAEAYSMELLRSFYGFKTATLRRVIDNFRKETKMKRPLLDADLKVVLGRSVVFEKPARGKQPVRMVDLAHERNLVFPELVQMLGQRVQRDHKHKLYKVLPWRLAKSDDSEPVSLDPEVLSGRLVVTGTRTPVSALLGLKKAGNNTSEIARFYGLGEDQVGKALLHVERLIRKKAA